jgi:hypothetical protein
MLVPDLPHHSSTLVSPCLVYASCSHFGFGPAELLPTRPSPSVAQMGRKAGSGKAGEDRLDEEAGGDAALPTAAADAAAGSTLLQDMAEPSRKRRRQNGRRGEDEQIERSIQQHFAHLPVLVVETTRVDGLLIRDRIAKDRKAMKDECGNSRLGASYWRQLVQLYSAGVEGVQTMEVKDPSLPAQDALIQGLEAACRNNPATRTMEPLVVFLQHTAPLNQKELVGLFKALDSGNSMGKVNSDLVMVEVMKYLVRAKQTELYAQEIANMKASFDEALTRHSSAPSPAHANISSIDAQPCMQDVTHSS